MENGSDASFSNDGGEGIEQWNNGLDTLLSQSGLSSSSLGQSLGASAEELQAESYTPVYSMGDMEGYTTTTLSTTAIMGVCAGFGLAIGVALLSYAISAVMSAFRGVVES